LIETSFGLLKELGKKTIDMNPAIIIPEIKLKFIPKFLLDTFDK
jgi:hypothetical protein